MRKLTIEVQDVTDPRLDDGDEELQISPSGLVHKKHLPQQDHHHAHARKPGDENIGKAVSPRLSSI